LIELNVFVKSLFKGIVFLKIATIVETLQGGSLFMIAIEALR